jgi:hypothetical protein
MTLRIARRIAIATTGEQIFMHDWSQNQLARRIFESHQDPAQLDKDAIKIMG